MSNRKGAGKTVNRTELAEFFGVAMPTIDHWVRTGCPADQRGSKGVSWKFNTADVAAWREQKARDETAGTVLADESEIKRRRAEVGLKRDELALAREMGEVAPIEQFERAMANVFAELRGKLRQIPSRAAPRVLGQIDDNAVKKILLEEIDLALEALSGDQLLDVDALDDDEQDEDDAA